MPLSLFINMAHDAAGVSYRQAEAINKHTNWSTRHFRAVPTFYSESDITPENYNKDEFLDLIKKSDILHFCSADHKYESQHDFGFNWEDAINGKKCIFHDYNSFPGRWTERAAAKDYWNRMDNIGYNAIFSSIPQAIEIYDHCIYIPDLVDEQSEKYTPNENRDFTRIIIGHFPTGGGNNKNTSELLQSCHNAGINRIIGNWDVNASIDSNFCINASGMSHDSIINIKKVCNFGFDAIWRGFHGMTTVENLSLGIPTMTSADGCFEQVFKEFHQTDQFPFEVVNDINTITNCINHYKTNLDKLEERALQVRKFMVEFWNSKNIAERIVKEYEKL